MDNRLGESQNLRAEWVLDTPSWLLPSSCCVTLGAHSALVAGLGALQPLVTVTPEPAERDIQRGGSVRPGLADREALTCGPAWSQGPDTCCRGEHVLSFTQQI